MTIGTREIKQIFNFQHHRRRSESSGIFLTLILHIDGVGTGYQVVQLNSVLEYQVLEFRTTILVSISNDYGRAVPTYR